MKLLYKIIKNRVIASSLFKAYIAYGIGKAQKGYWDDMHSAIMNLRAFEIAINATLRDNKLDLGYAEIEELLIPDEEVEELIDLIKKYYEWNWKNRNK